MAISVRKETRERLIAWWNGEGYDGRPCILAQLSRQKAEPEERFTPDEFWRDPEKMARIRARRMKNTDFLGEAVPYLYMDYGANAVALQLGAKGRWTSDETIWTDPCAESVKEVANLKIGGEWASIQSAAIDAGIRACDGKAMLSSYCLGSAADLTAALAGTEELLYEMVDNPEDAEKAMAHIADVIIRHFKELEARCAEGGTVLNGWHGIWAPEATTPLQEDFSYMIGPDMFRRFCLRHIRDIADAVPYAFYHLDGIGALRHLDALLQIPALRAIQWQPGEGHMRMGQWIDVIRKILSSGKSCQVYANAEDIEMLTREVGPARMLYIVCDTRENILRLADRYGLESADARG